MPRPTRLKFTLPALAFAALAVAGSAASAQTYRIVGPDGRVTFSDRKPTDANVQTSVVGHSAPPPPLFASGSAGKRAASPMTGAAGALPPGLPEATLDVVSREDLVQSVWDTCTRTLPASYDRYDDATHAWKKHNAAVIAKTDRILFSAFTAEQREMIHATAQTRLQATMAPVAKVDKATKIQWCDRWVKDLAAGAPDLVADAALAGPILAYTLP